MLYVNYKGYLKIGIHHKSHPVVRLKNELLCQVVWGQCDMLTCDRPVSDVTAAQHQNKQGGGGNSGQSLGSASTAQQVKHTSQYLSFIYVFRKVMTL